MSEVVRVNVGAEEFGEVIHMGAYAILLGPYRLTVRVVNVHPDLNFNQIKHFFDHCQAICTDTSNRPTKNGDIPPNETTEQMQKLKSKQKASQQGTYVGQIKASFQSLGRANRCGVEGELSTILGDRKRNKVLVWVRPTRDNRGMTDAALKEICVELQRAQYVPVIIGQNPSKPIKNTISIVETHRRLYRQEKTFGKQASMYLKLLELGVIAQVGLQSGGLDFAAFCGIPTANITQLVASSRMKALTQITNVKNIEYDSSKYQAIEGQTLPRGTADKAIEAIKNLTS